MSKLFARFRKNESGATAIEYGLIAALIAVAIVAGAGILGDTLDGQFQWIAGELSEATDGGNPVAGGGEE
jgi:pilus assembly protein Flp/PilA